MVGEEVRGVVLRERAGVAVARRSGCKYWSWDALLRNLIRLLRNSMREGVKRNASAPLALKSSPEAPPQTKSVVVYDMDGFNKEGKGVTKNQSRPPTLKNPTLAHQSPTHNRLHRRSSPRSSD